MNFQPLLDEFGIHLTADDLLARWREPHRKYHTLSHLDDLVEQIKRCDLLPEKERHILFLAALFHDIVYDPTRTDNEEASVQLLLQNSTPSDELQLIAQIIRDTAHHTPTEPLSKVFSEMDMAIVTRPFDDLVKWEHGIWFEYAHYSRVAYTWGRVRFLRNLIKRYPNNKKNLKKLLWHVLLQKGSKGI
jgi:predicted metal-dependent HD superfamily phosphohydrolase